MLRRITKLAEGRSRIFTGGYGPINYRLLQMTLISTHTNNINSTAKRALSFSGGWAKAAIIAGTMLFSTAAISTLVEKVSALELRPNEVIPPNEVILYQYNPFFTDLDEWIISAFLDYYDIPYKIMKINYQVSKALQWSCYETIPRLIVDGELIVDSVDKRDIIDNLANKLNLDFAAHSVIEHNEEKKWRCWVETHLIHMVLLSMCRSNIDLSKSVSFLDDHGNSNFLKRVELKLRGLRASLNMRTFNKLHKVTDEYAALFKAVEKWVDALNGRDFLGGTKPNLADLAVFGVLRQLYDHTRKDMVENTRIGDWYSRMECAVGMSSKSS